MNAAFYFGCAVVAVATALLPESTILDVVATFAAVWGLVAVHEIGHLVVAQACGYRARLRFVLPGYGRTTVWSPGGRGWGYVAMAVAGPAAGILYGAALAWASPSLRFLGWVAVAESLVNLLPFGLMDGAKALETYRRMRRARRVQEMQALNSPFLRSVDDLLLRGLPPPPRRRRMRSA